MQSNNKLILAGLKSSITKVLDNLKVIRISISPTLIGLAEILRYLSENPSLLEKKSKKETKKNCLIFLNI